MKNIIKSISLFLAFLMMFTLCFPAFAAEGEREVCPVIHLRGIASSNVYADKSDESTLIKIPDADTLSAFVQEDIIPALIIYSADHNAENLAKEISAVVNAAFADWFNNSDGTPVDNAGTIMEYPAPDKITEDSKLRFEYDWRGDPFVIAAELDAYINYVLECSDAEKVSLTCHSLGSVAVITYLTVYGDEKVSGIVLDTPAAFGVSTVGELISGKIKINNESLTYFLKFMLGENEYDKLMVSLVDIFELAGIPEMFSVFIDTVMAEIGPTFYKETLAPMFGYWLTIWAMTPDDMIDEAMDYYFNDLCKDEDLSALKAKIVAYNTIVRETKEEILVDFDSKGKLAVISRHGYASLPLEDSWSLIGDSVIETQSSSIGATTAPAGDYFSDEYLEGKDMKYISPNRTIDASTCLFPEKTWFINNAIHQETYMSGKLYDTFLFSAEELTCDTSELPRFSYYDKANDKLIADTTEPEKVEELSPLMRLYNFVVALLGSVIDFLVGLFSE